jgi:hypothetical protein
MARHWSAFVAVTEKQARALDKMAQDNGYGDGMDLLMEVSGDSRSKVGKRDRLTVAGYVDECFKRFGRN